MRGGIEKDKSLKNGEAGEEREREIARMGEREKFTWLGFTIEDLSRLVQ